MIHFFQGIAFKPKHTKTVSPKRRTLKQNLTYDGSIMIQIRNNLKSIKQLIQERNER